MLEAEGLQVGTRFLVVEECGIHQVYKDRILKAKDIDTIATGKRLGHPVRAQKEPFHFCQGKGHVDGKRD